MNREQAFRNITGDAESKAVMKYYFLLATAGKMFGHNCHCIPVNKDFFKNLTKVSNQYGKAESDIEVNHEGRRSRRLIAGYQRRALVIEAPVPDTSDDENDSESAVK